MEHKSKSTPADHITNETGERSLSAARSSEESMRQKRSESLLNAKKTLELAEQLRLVSLNVAIQSAKTRGSSKELRKIKSELSELTNQAVKASRELGSIINAVGADEPVESSKTHDYRKALRLKQDLEGILVQAGKAVRALEQLDFGSSDV